MMVRVDKSMIVRDCIAGERVRPSHVVSALAQVALGPVVRAGNEAVNGCRVGRDDLAHQAPGMSCVVTLPARS
jgi:hypothetical protein